MSQSTQSSDSNPPDHRSTDAKDFAAQFEKHRRSLGHFLLGLTKDPAQVQDLLQSTFVKLSEKGDSIQNQQAIQGWLFRVAYNEAMMFRRRQQMANKHLSQFAGQIDWGQRMACDPGDRILEAELRKHVIDALSQLSKEQFEVVQKRIYQGLKFREIAHELDVPLGTVLARMQASLKKLKTVLEPFQKEN